jgi:hypothetical protein
MRIGKVGNNNKKKKERENIAQLPIIMLNVNDLNFPIKKHRF